MKIMNEKKDLYIRALEFAEKKEIFTFHDLCENINPNKTQKELLELQIDKGQLFFYRSHSFLTANNKNVVYLFFTVEDKFRLLEYVELKEARSASNTATYFAVAALFISIVFFIISICFSYQGQKAEINYPDSLKKTIEDIANNSELIEQQTKEQSELFRKLLLQSNENIDDEIEILISIKELLLEQCKKSDYKDRPLNKAIPVDTKGYKTN